VSTPTSGYLDTPPLAFAHRGGAADGDENTADAFGRAVEMGYLYLETDVHATADGEVVVFHDDTLDRLLGRPGRVRDVRWADLKALRVGGVAAVPRLADVLEAWPNVRFNIDMKDDPAVGPNGGRGPPRRRRRPGAAGLVRHETAGPGPRGPPGRGHLDGDGGGGAPVAASRAGRRAAAAGRRWWRPRCRRTTAGCGWSTGGSSGRRTAAGCRCTCGPSTIRTP
jgi:hypothetical protein